MGMQSAAELATEREVEVLLVEDNPADAELALRALQKNKLSNRIHWVKDGAEALEFLLGGAETAERRAPRVVFLDIKLPKVDGIEVLRRVKADARTRNIPIVMMTSSREERDMVESYRLGVNSYVVKPVDFEQFSKAVTDVGFYWMLINQPLR